MKRGNKLATALIVLAFIFVVTLSVMSAAAGQADDEQAAVMTAEAGTPMPETYNYYFPFVAPCPMFWEWRCWP